MFSRTQQGSVKSFWSVTLGVCSPRLWSHIWLFGSSDAALWALQTLSCCVSGVPSLLTCTPARKPIAALPPGLQRGALAASVNAQLYPDASLSAMHWTQYNPSSSTPKTQQVFLLHVLRPPIINFLYIMVGFFVWHGKQIINYFKEWWHWLFLFGVAAPIINYVWHGALITINLYGMWLPTFSFLWETLQMVLGVVKRFRALGYTVPDNQNNHWFEKQKKIKYLYM